MRGEEICGQSEMAEKEHKPTDEVGNTVTFWEGQAGPSDGGCSQCAGRGPMYYRYAGSAIVSLEAWTRAPSGESRPFLPIR